MQNNQIKIKMRYYAPINVKTVGGVWARGGDLTREQKIRSTSQGWGIIRSSNVAKNPHPVAKYQVKYKLCTSFYLVT